MELIQTIGLSIRFFLNGYPQEKRETYTLYAQLIYRRQKTVFSLKMNTTPEDWDLKNEMFFPTKQFNLVRNNKLREIREKLLLIYFDLKKSDLPVSAKLIKNSYSGKLPSTAGAAFTDYFSEHIEELKLKVTEYTPGTIAHYIKAQTHLHKFLQANGWKNITLPELNRGILERFEHYLLTTPNEQTGRPMNGNTSTTYIRKIKASINAALRRNLIQINPFAGFKLRSFKTVNKLFLTLEEIEILKEHDLGGNLSLQKVKDVFLFSCMTGLRHSDVLRLNQSMINVDSSGLHWITIKQQKTGDNLEIPMLDYAVDIYEKYAAYRQLNNGKALPVISNQKVNSALKIISELAGINKRLSFHCARHTFATTTLEQGIDIKTVSALMGHTSIKSTEIYAKLTRKRKADVIKFLNDQNNKKELPFGMKIVS